MDCSQLNNQTNHNFNGLKFNCSFFSGSLSQFTTAKADLTTLSLEKDFQMFYTHARLQQRLGFLWTLMWQL